MSPTVVGKRIGLGGGRVRVFLRVFLRVLVRVLALGYPLSLLLIVLALRCVGERWWGTTVLMYLPRKVFLVPLPFITLALLWLGPRRWLLTQVAAAGLLVFPLLGLKLSLPSSSSRGATRLRVFSLNIASGKLGLDAIAAQIRAADPDVVLLQEAWAKTGERLRDGLPEYHFELDGQLVIASRYPLVDAFAPPTITVRGIPRAPRWLRCRIALPGGRTVAVYDLHPISPREGFVEMRGEGIRSEVLSGRILSNDKAREDVEANAELRVAQVRSAAEDAGRTKEPAILAGDTNLPGLSWALAHHLGRFHDGFSEAGNGLGYTFPATKEPWMRIDRILADGSFRFVSFSVVTERVSDHLAVVADLELEPGR
jgi:endonuclease/exonuclease/phosphatase family metal-dependent hydrolase